MRAGSSTIRWRSASWVARCQKLNVSWAATVSRPAMNISRQKFMPTEYAELKALFDLMIQKKEELVVIRKKD